MKKNIFLTTGLICCFIVCVVANSGMDGDWAGSLKAPDGNAYPLSYHFKVDGTKLTGTATSISGTEVDILDGKINGSDFTFTLPLKPQDVPHQGKFYGDSIGVNLTIHNTKFHVKLTRSKKQ